MSDKKLIAPTKNEEWKQRGQRMAAAAFGCVPMIGPLLQQTVTEFIPDKKTERLTEYLKQVDKKTQDLDDCIKNIEAAIARFADILEAGAWQAGRASSDERIERIANLVAKGFTSDEVEQRKVAYFQGLVDQLDDQHLVFLASNHKNKKIATYYLQKFGKQVSPLAHRESVAEFFDQAEEVTIPDEIATLQNEINHGVRSRLEGLGLLVDQVREYTHSENGKTTDLGVLFLEYLGMDKIDDN